MTTNIDVHPAITPTHIQQLSLRNRLVVAPMSRISASEAGVPGAAMQTYYEGYASGGFGLIVSEGVYTDAHYSQAYPNQPGLVTAAQVAGWRQITSAVKAAGAAIVAQLMHAGTLSQYHPVPKGPSAIQPVGTRLHGYGGEGSYPVPAALTVAEIAQVVAGYAAAAQRAVEAGFDGIEVHAANGYLPDQFLTAHTNTRTDAYGGTVVNRFRFIDEVIQAIRAVVPAGFLVGLRLSEGKVNQLDYRWPEGAAMAKEVLEAARVSSPSYIHIAAEGGSWAAETTYADGSTYSGLARAITGLPVIANGGLHDTVAAAHVLSEGHADLIAIGRAALKDPMWPRQQYGLSY